LRKKKIATAMTLPITASRRARRGFLASRPSTVEPSNPPNARIMKTMPRTTPCPFAPCSVSCRVSTRLGTSARTTASNTRMAVMEAPSMIRKSLVLTRISSSAVAVMTIRQAISRMNEPADELMSAMPVAARNCRRY
jgi:hypothetical protein